MSETTPQLLTVAEAVAWAGIPRNTLYKRYLGPGLLVPRKIGKATRVVVSELAALIANLSKG
jgi:hypothetical protein